MKKLMDVLCPFGSFGAWVYITFSQCYYNWACRGGDRAATIRKYKKIYGKTPQLDEPHSLNEKILWLKLNDHTPLHTLCADKYTVRSYLKDKFGEKYLIPLFYVTDDYKTINNQTIPDEPCIIKASHSQGDMLIVRDKNKIDLKRLRFEMRIWMKRNIYYETQEWQYKDCKPRIIIEKLLQDKDGHIPNDYKLHFINGKLEFVYCSIGRESINKRNIYDANWDPLLFSWVAPNTDVSNIRGEEIPAPSSFEEMKRIGCEIAKDFPYYVRVDFYDVDGKLYFGEITFHHGGGFDVLIPHHYDDYYGNILKLPKM